MPMNQEKTQAQNQVQMILTLGKAAKIQGNQQGNASAGERLDKWVGEPD